jgi:hypothetical protein
MTDLPPPQQSPAPDEPPLDAPDLVSVPLTPPDGQAPIVEQARIDPQTAATAPDAGTKMFVTFFFLIVPPLGILLLAAVCWMLFKKFMAA